MKNDYQILLESPQWLKKRETILARDGRKCRNCGSMATLQVHHRQYHIIIVTGKFQPPWAYENLYLITLCDKCHTLGHSLYKVPTFKL
jgi:5-methylcytosine-specific restriction endonuclease McrA